MTSGLEDWLEGGALACGGTGGENDDIGEVENGAVSSDDVAGFVDQGRGAFFDEAHGAVGGAESISEVGFFGGAVGAHRGVVFFGEEGAVFGVDEGKESELSTGEVGVVVAEGGDGLAYGVVRPFSDLKENDGSLGEDGLRGELGVLVGVDGCEAEDIFELRSSAGLAFEFGEGFFEGLVESGGDDVGAAGAVVDCSEPFPMAFDGVRGDVHDGRDLFVGAAEGGELEDLGEFVCEGFVRMRHCYSSPGSPMVSPASCGRSGPWES